jgi:hypothetical protein
MPSIWKKSSVHLVNVSELGGIVFTEYNIYRISSIDRDMIGTMIMLGSILIISQLTVQVQARNITAFIHFNEQAILQDNDGGDLSGVWFTVDGQRYDNTEYDMSDWVYGSDPVITTGIFTKDHPKELVISDNASIICLESGSLYKSCNGTGQNITEIHFTYPTTWQEEH